MINLMYNFTNVTDEVMTQRELEKSPAGVDFIQRWTWPCQDGYKQYPRFRMTNTVEDYFYVRAIEADMLLAVGAIRIHWDEGSQLMTDNNIQIVLCAHDFHYCEDPRERYDLKNIIQEKLYQYLRSKLDCGRYTNRPAVCPCPPPPPERPCTPPPPPPKPCREEPPYYRGYDDRGLFYKNHNYRPKCNERHPNRPVNGPYGGTYNAYDEVHHRGR